MNDKSHGGWQQSDGPQSDETWEPALVLTLVLGIGAAVFLAMIPWP